MSEKKCPNNLQALLKFCVEADDGSNLKDLDVNSDEAKERTMWLKKVMAETCVNIGQKTIENINILYKFTENKETLENSITALEELQDITEHIDYAKDFIKMGGFDLIKQLLETHYDEILIETCQLIGNITQNDEFCQSMAIISGFIELLLNKIKNCNNGNVVKKMVYSLSCCIRGNCDGIQKFKVSNGTEILLESMNKGTGEASIKCAFLLFCLINETENIVNVLNESEFIELMKLILNESNVTNSILEYLVGVVAICVKQKSALKKYIDDQFISNLNLKLSQAQNKSELEELVTHINFILNNVEYK